MILRFTKKDKEEHKKVLIKRKRLNSKGRFSNGYSLSYYPTHPNVGTNGYIPTHILVVEYFEERFLNTGRRKNNEVVHHKNFKKLDNRYSNLEVWLRGEHSSFHKNLELKDKNLSYRKYKWLYLNYVIKGYSYKKIAEICGCSVQPIKTYVHKFNLKDKKKKFKSVKNR